jgi:hypothetical protein
MLSLVDHVGYIEVPNPHEWQFFDAPQLARRPRIRIPLQNYPGCGKFVIDNEIDNEVDDDTPGDIDQENTPATSPITRKTGLLPMVRPLQVINPNLRSSYIRKVKGTKHTVIDLESDQLDSDQDE